MTDFLLHTSTAQALYHEVAASLPVIDYHTHLSPERFLNNGNFAHMDALWLETDPYKWRAMRMHGVPEEEITGNIDPRKRFQAWAATLPKLAGNPLSHWCHMELTQFFGIDEWLGPDNADRIYDACNAQLSQPDFRPQALLDRSRMEVLVTSDDWLDDLDAHRQASSAELKTRIRPSLRADAALDFESASFADFRQGLEQRTGQATDTLEGYVAGLTDRLDFFASAGCVIADHGIDELEFAPFDQRVAARSYETVIRGGSLNSDDAAALRSYVFLQVAAAYAQRGWTLLLHLGAQRNTSTRLAQTVGRAGGYAAIGNPIDCGALTQLLDAMERHMEHQGGLPRTIIFPLNPNDYEAVASLCGSFVEDGVPGKVQLGPAWWYNDHRTGIERHLSAVADHAVLGHFLGMVTDSRSFLSGVRHDYFRRVLCNRLGAWIEAGEIPNDNAQISELIQAICYRNAATMLGFD